MAKIIAVHGATGQQGGSVVKALSNSEWKVRALTRNPSGDSAKALIDAGAEVVQANLDDERSLVKAYEGVEAIFLVTNFWEHLFTGKTAIQSGEAEFAQALTVIKAADKLPTLKHFIWSTVPGNVEGQAKRTAVPHFDYKAAIDNKIRKEYPNLAVKTTYLYVGFYANNLVNIPNLKPFVTPGTFGTYVWMVPGASDAVIPSAGDVTHNVGVFVKAILAQPQKTHGKYAAVVTDTPTDEEMLNHWVAATGKRAVHVEVTGRDWMKVFGPPGEELYLNLKAFQENPKWAFDNDPLLGKDLGIEEDLIDTKTYFESVKEKLL